jgi:hypothetical protein
MYGPTFNITNTPNTNSSYSSPLFAVQVNGINALIVGSTSGTTGGYAFLDLRVNSSAPDYSSTTLADNGTFLTIGKKRSIVSLCPENGAAVVSVWNVFRVGSAGSIGISTSPDDTAADVLLTRAAAAAWRLGAADAAAPVAQTLQVQSVVAGTSNTAGVDWTLQGSRGTGTGAGGSIVFKVAPAGSTGTSQNALATALTIDSTKTSTFAGNLIFGTDNAYDIGASGANRPKTLYTAAWAYIGGGVESSGLRLMAGSNLYWNNATIVSGATDGVFSLTNYAETAGAALYLLERTAPSAPAANRVYIYAEDNGAGKTRLMALFQSGAAQQIAIEP